jgi:hypothetical protein
VSNYTARLIITIPADLLPTGRAIARALDPDVGGYDSYAETTDGWVADMPCRPEFVAQAMYMISRPAALHAAVAADYAARWPDLIPPTLAECEAFCAGAVLATAQPPSIE